MSVPTADPTVHTPAPGPPRRRGDGGAGWIAGGRFYLYLAGAALLIAVISLTLPSTPSYDPWAWLVWGKEIIHGSLHTPGGPTWKPLPVIFTTLFAPFGSAQPDMWLVVARAGAITACVMVFKLTARIVWWIGERPVEPGEAGPQSFGERAAALAPALVCGAMAMAAFALAQSGGFLSASALGYSEGLMVACVFVAFERHLDGHTHQAFAVGFAAALDRPELWPFWGLYGIWLFWKDPSSRRLVIGLFIANGVLWFGPQWWSTGSPFSGVARAIHPRSNSAAFASCPFCAELHLHAWPQVLLRLKAAAALAVAVAVSLTWSQWGGRPGWRLASARERGIVLIALFGTFGLLWWVIVAIETQAHFSGNDRYLVLGSACIEIAGAAGFGWAAIAFARWARRRVARLRSALSLPRATALATALASIVFLAVPNWVGANLVSIPRTHGSLVYQATLRKDLSYLIGYAGGPKKVLACGTVMTEGFQVPMVAWYLGVRTLEILAPPATNPETGVAGTFVQDKFVPQKIWPNVILQDQDTRGATLLPLPNTIIAWEHDGAKYKVKVTRAFRLFEDCRG